jgi:hypothetical protein
MESFLSPETNYAGLAVQKLRDRRLANVVHDFAKASNCSADVPPDRLLANSTGTVWQ